MALQWLSIILHTLIRCTRPFPIWPVYLLGHMAHSLYSNILSSKWVLKCARVSPQGLWFFFCCNQVNINFIGMTSYSLFKCYSSWKSSLTLPLCSYSTLYLLLFWRLTMSYCNCLLTSVSFTKYKFLEIRGLILLLISHFLAYGWIHTHIHTLEIL